MSPTELSCWTVFSAASAFPDNPRICRAHMGAHSGGFIPSSQSRSALIDLLYGIVYFGFFCFWGGPFLFVLIATVHPSSPSSFCVFFLGVELFYFLHSLLPVLREVSTYLFSRATAENVLDTSYAFFFCVCCPRFLTCFLGGYPIYSWRGQLVWVLEAHFELILPGNRLQILSVALLFLKEAHPSSPIIITILFLTPKRQKSFCFHIAIIMLP